MSKLFPSNNNNNKSIKILKNIWSNQNGFDISWKALVTLKCPRMSLEREKKKKKSLDPVTLKRIWKWWFENFRCFPGWVYLITWRKNKKQQQKTYFWASFLLHCDYSAVGMWKCAYCKTISAPKMYYNHGNCTDISAAITLLKWFVPTFIIIIGIVDFLRFVCLRFAHILKIIQICSGRPAN